MSKMILDLFCQRSKGLAVRFYTNFGGSVVLALPLLLIPVITAVSAAVDYSKASNARSILQKAADATALQMVIANLNDRPQPDLVKLFKSNYFSGFATDDLNINGRWLTPGKVYQVEVSNKIKRSLSPLPASMNHVNISVKSVAEGLPDEFTSQTIEGFNLSVNAADYNELYGYCYDPIKNQRLGPVNTANGERLSYLKIADNSDAGISSSVTNLDMVCKKGENHSYYLRNVRNVRHNPSLGNPADTYFYYADVTLKAGSDNTLIFKTSVENILETILCDNKKALDHHLN